MKVLYSAFACDPNKGSEAQCGWAWVEAMRKYLEVHVLTREENKVSIDSYIGEKHLSDIYVHYCDVPKWMNTYNTWGKWYFLYYLLWQNAAYAEAKKLHSILNLMLSIMYH